MNTMKNPPSGDQGLAFQTHTLQMILFGPFYVRPQTVTVRYEIVSLQDIYIYIYIYMKYKKPLHILKIYSLENM